MKFKNVGRTLKEVDKSKIKKENIDSFEKPFGIDLPLRKKTKKGETLFAMTYGLDDQIKVNLKNLVMTSRGEKLGDPDFGTDLIKIYNSTNLENIEEIAMNDIKVAIDKFMPFVILGDFSSEKILATQETSSYYNIKVNYTVDRTDIKNQLNIKINTSR